MSEHKEVTAEQIIMPYGFHDNGVKLVYLEDAIKGAEEFAQQKIAALQSSQKPEVDIEDIDVIRAMYLNMLPTGESKAWDWVQASQRFITWLDEYKVIHPAKDEPSPAQEVEKPDFEGHTPGPWKVVRNHTHSVEISGHGWTRFARVFVRLDGDEEDSPEGLANAKLIAAAPDLLKENQSLKDRVKELERFNTEKGAVIDQYCKLIREIELREKSLEAENEELKDILKEAYDHLEYCGYGDSWESSIAYDSKLPERLRAIIEPLPSKPEN